VGELDNTPHDPRVPKRLNQLLYQYVPEGMEAPLPGVYGTASSAARKQYLGYVALLNALSHAQLTNGNLGLYTDYGAPL
jgi:hypothetical protein